MFLHQHHLRHLLRPEHYTGTEQHRREVERLFVPAWHPVAAAAELARPGDFRTLTLLDTPILLRNFGGELRAFLNVCPHRHSMLTDKVCGNTERLRCQYHGWEFNADGRTGKIPDAKAFRPWDRDNSCLTRFALEQCGGLVFVRLSEQGPTLREWLAPVWGHWEQAFGPDYRHAGTWEKQFPCNWKVVLENSLESYHIPEVHPKTFGDYPTEDNAFHEMTPEFSSFRTVPSDFASRAERWCVRRLGMSAPPDYWHRVRHPHATGSGTVACKMMQCVFPTGPTTCLYRCIFFVARGRRRGSLARASAAFLRAVGKGVAKRVFVEDASIYEGVQRGVAASPHRGVIGTREERIWNFQRYVLDRTEPQAGERLPLPEAAALESRL